MLGPRGLRGELKIQLARSSDALAQGRLILTTPHAEQNFAIRRVVARDPQTIVVELEGIEDRVAAEAWSGARAMVESSWFGPGEGPLERLIGARAIDAESGAELGTVVAIEDNGAQELLVIGRAGAEWMVPLVEALVPSIEEPLDGPRQVRIRVIPGLFEG